jgi:hypothetical protein
VFGYFKYIFSLLFFLPQKFINHYETNIVLDICKIKRIKQNPHSWQFGGAGIKQAMMTA